MENEDSAIPPCVIPERLFQAGEEPTGVRVTPYHKPFGIKQILNVLDPDEIEQIRASPFGKFVELADKPSFSGRFGRYIICRQLKVAKKYEVWFVFAGKPIRFSLREFAIVTGLNCEKCKKRSKKRLANRTLTEKPYWGELFGTLKEVPVSSDIRMLKSRGVIRPDLRLKYAYLALLSSVILPTTHTPKICEDYAEMIKDIDYFLAYPWGRVAFRMLIGSINERKEVALSQNTIALKGFVLALQLVMVEAVPALTEVVRDGSSSGSEDEYGQDEDIIAGQKSISPGHARDTDAAGKAIVHSIISTLPIQGIDETELDWSDDEADTPVDNLTKLIQEGFPFKHSSFVGGVSKLDVIRMREETKQSVNRKTSKGKNAASSELPGGLDVEVVSAVVKDCLRNDFSRLETQLATLSESSISFQTQVISHLKQMLSNVGQCTERPNLTKSTKNAATQTNLHCGNNSADLDGHEGQPSGTDGPPLAEGGGLQHDQSLTPNSSPSRGVEDHPQNTAAEISSDSTMDPALLLPDPTFSLGLTQEERVVLDKVVSGCIVGANEEDALAESDDIAVEKGKIGVACRKSKRAKNPPKSLVGNYECDKRFLNHGRQTVPESYMFGGSTDYSAKFSVLLDKMKTPFTITGDKWTLESKELYGMVDRSTPTSDKVLDVLISHITALYRCNSHQKLESSCLFMDTQTVAKICDAYSTFSKVLKKESFQFPETVLSGGAEKSSFLKADRFYLLFNVEKKYWVGLCIDMSSWVLYVLDWNLSAKSDYMMSKEVKPLAQMFPHFARQLGKPLGSKVLKPLAIERPRTIPQTTTLLDSAVAAILLIHAHADGGVDACKRITTDLLETELQRLAMTLYEGNVGPL